MAEPTRASGSKRGAEYRQGAVLVNAAIGQPFRSAERMGPRARKTHPSARRMQPRARRMQPRARRMQPSARGMGPRARRMPPGARRAHPRARKTHPSAKGMQPTARRMGPRARKVHPSARRTHPYAVSRLESSAWAPGPCRAPRRTSPPRCPSAGRRDPGRTFRRPAPRRLRPYRGPGRLRPRARNRRW
jgi:hypothetical protein